LSDVTSVTTDFQLHCLKKTVFDDWYSESKGNNISILQERKLDFTSYTSYSCRFCSKSFGSLKEMIACLNEHHYKAMLGNDSLPYQRILYK
jgi:hypothetical protein